MSNTKAIRILDHFGRQIEFDHLAAGGSGYGYFINVDLEHHKIHEGNHWTCQDLATGLSANTPKYWHYKTPDLDSVYWHFVFELRASNGGILRLYEDPTLSADGTQLACYNNNRNMAAVNPTLTMYKDPTVTALGTKILLQNVLGSSSGAGSGGAESREREFVLKKNTSYLVEFTPFANSTTASCCAEHYEVDKR